MERLLVLEDGSTYRGRSFGGENFRIGELVFNMLVLVGTVKMADRVVR